MEPFKEQQVVERRSVNRELIEKVHEIELSMAKRMCSLKSDIKVLEVKLLEMTSSVTRLHRTFYGTFIAVFLTYIFDKFF